MAEEAAWSYAKENGLDMISVCPSICIGPLLQPTVNASNLFLICIVKELDKANASVDFVNIQDLRNLLLVGISEPLKDITWNFLDIRDFADAMLLVFEKPEASGRYICAPTTCSVKEMVGMLKSMYPQFDCQDKLLEGGGGTLLSCERLKALGWNHRPLEESVRDAVEYYQRAGLLDEGHSINVPPLFSI